MYPLQQTVLQTVDEAFCVPSHNATVPSTTRIINGKFSTSLMHHRDIEFPNHNKYKPCFTHRQNADSFKKFDVASFKSQ
jgi:hypothetical protein